MTYVNPHPRDLDHLLPPTSPLADDPPDPRVLTEAELLRVARVRAAWSWYGDAHASDDVRFLLGLLDRLTGDPTTDPTKEVNRGTTTVSEDPLPVPGGGAPRAAPPAAAPAGEPRPAVRPPPAADVAPDEAAGLVGRLDGLRAALDVLLDDVAFTYAGGPVAWSVSGERRHVTAALDRLVDRLTPEVEGSP